MHEHLNEGKSSHLQGVWLDTCARRRSVMSKQHYTAYCRNVGSPTSLRTIDGASIQGIGGRMKSIGTAIVQIPVRQLQLIIDLEFLVIPDDIPYLWSMKYMVHNGTNIRIQHHHDRLGDHIHKLSMENYFLSHRWSRTSMPFSFYTETECSTVERSKR